MITSNLHNRAALAVIAATMAGSLLVPPAAAEPAPERQRQLLHQLLQDCGSCHGLTMKGGLGPALLPASLKEKEDEYLVSVILGGVHGTPMPPWEFEISRDEASWLVQRLREGVSHESN